VGPVLPSSGFRVRASEFGLPIFIFRLFRRPIKKKRRAGANTTVESLESSKSPGSRVQSPKSASSPKSSAHGREISTLRLPAPGFGLPTDFCLLTTD
jgi:hypothetical protein